MGAEIISTGLCKLRFDLWGAGTRVIIEFWNFKGGGFSQAIIADNTDMDLPVIFIQYFIGQPDLCVASIVII